MADRGACHRTHRPVPVPRSIAACLPRVNLFDLEWYGRGRTGSLLTYCTVSVPLVSSMFVALSYTRNAYVPGTRFGNDEA